MEEQIANRIAQLLQAQAEKRTLSIQEEIDFLRSLDNFRQGTYTNEYGEFCKACDAKY